MDTQRIEKDVVLPAARGQVWRAITESGRFGEWFGARIDGPFVAGQRVGGRIEPTRVDADVAAQQAPYAGMQCDFAVERIEPMRLFAFRWHALPDGPATDPQGDNMTLVEFHLDDADGGTRLRIVESGFERLPAEHRARVRTEHDHGWGMQAQLIGRYLALHADDSGS